MIANPVAGRGIQRQVQSALDVLDGGPYQVELHWTNAAGHAVALARQAAQEQVDLVVVVGGDGTLNEVINGLATTETPLGIIPVGTVNCFALETGIPQDARRAARLLLESQPRRIHLGQAGERYFALMAGIGFDADVVYSVNARLKRRLGKIAYILRGMVYLFQFSPPPLQLILDQNERLEGYGVVIGNMRHYAGRFYVTPHASFDLEELDVCLFQGQGIRAVIRSVREVISGKHLMNPEVVYRKAREIQVTSERPACVQVDGEYYGKTPLHFRIVPHALTVLLPPD